MPEKMSCNVCCFPFNEKDRLPMTLGMCGHTYCRECIIKLVESGCVSRVGSWDPISGPAQCPECRVWSDPMCIKPNRVLIGNLFPERQRTANLTEAYTPTVEDRRESAVTSAPTTAAPLSSPAEAATGQGRQGWEMYTRQEPQPMGISPLLLAGLNLSLAAHSSLRSSPEPQTSPNSRRGGGGSWSDPWRSAGSTEGAPPSTAGNGRSAPRTDNGWTNPWWSSGGADTDSGVSWLEAAKKSGNIPMNIGQCSSVEEDDQQQQEEEGGASPETPPLPSRIPMPLSLPESVQLPKRIPIPVECKGEWKSGWAEKDKPSAVLSPRSRYWDFGKKESRGGGGAASNVGRTGGIKWDSGAPTAAIWQGLPPPPPVPSGEVAGGQRRPPPKPKSRPPTLAELEARNSGRACQISDSRQALSYQQAGFTQKSQFVLVCVMVDLDGETCAICFDVYDGGTHAPMVLGRCGHTYCRSCIDTMMKRSSQNGVRCPECQRESDEACVVPNRVLLRQMPTARDLPAPQTSSMEEDCRDDAALAAILQMEEESLDGNWAPASPGRKVEAMPGPYPEASYSFSGIVEGPFGQNAFACAPRPPRTTVEPEAEEAVGSVASSSQASVPSMAPQRPMTAKVVPATGPVGDADWGVGSRWGETRRVDAIARGGEVTVGVSSSNMGRDRGSGTSRAREELNAVWDDWWKDTANNGCEWIWTARRSGNIPLNIGGAAESSANTTDSESSRPAECWGEVRHDGPLYSPPSSSPELQNQPMVAIPPRPRQIPVPSSVGVVPEMPSPQVAAESLPPLPQVIPPAMSVLPGARASRDIDPLPTVPPRPQYSPPVDRIGDSAASRGAARPPRRVYPADRGKLGSSAGRTNSSSSGANTSPDDSPTDDEIPRRTEPESRALLDKQ
ncbi:hypothetical protein FOL46_006916 [Perkinsus olseni]|uniref:RING-type domain-containing protein n=1 Tax=Perkinsus olseni TaxID=32597 RepID=A0A7J6MPN6_PEROL|nr:hypothetical protein FOL46_006916 [Perkinsus olseni]